MKKFVAGFLCGAVLSMSTAVFASETIQAHLFPSLVKFHINNGVKEVDGTDIFNYKDKAYIPLRSFAEAIGAKVTYESASGAAGNLNKIDIYSSSDLTKNELTLKDPDGYITIGNLNVITDQNGTKVLTSGTVQVNKDLTGKSIEIEALDKTGRRIGESDYVYVDNQDIEIPKPDDIRSFQTNLVFEGEVGSYRISVHDFLKSVHNETIDKRNGDPIAIMFGPPSNFNGDLSIGKINPFSIAIYNLSENNITVDPISIEFDVYKADSANQPGELVYSFKLPTISGLISRKSGYETRIPWNQKGTDGKVITPGKYLVTIKAPDSVNYSVDGSSDTKSYHIDLRVNHFGVQFN